MDYFYCPPEHIEAENLVIDGEEFSHLIHVMRKKEGDEIRVVDGKGNAYDVRLGSVKQHMVHGIILNTSAHHHESSQSVTLAVGILKNPSKFDFLVEKVTELGVREIVPVQTERTIPHHAKVDRWQKLALAAMKQCGRSFLPMVRELTTLDHLLASTQQYDLSLIAHENASHMSTIIPKQPTSRSIIILIGPEGGFTDEEVERCCANGYVTLYLGERRLRTETAAVVAAAMVLI